MAQNAAIPKPLIRRNDAQQRLGGISGMTIWRLEQTPNFPATIKIGGRVFFDEAEIDAYIEGCTNKKDQSQTEVGGI